MQTQDSPIAIDNPAIPEQYRHSIEAAHTFAAEALRGARVNYRICKAAGASDVLICEAQQHVYKTLMLLRDLASKLTGPIVHWKWNAAFGEHEVWIDGVMEISHPRRDVCERKLNEWFDWNRQVDAKNAARGIKPGEITSDALTATIADDDEITDEEIRAEFEFASNGEKKPVKEPYVKSAWDKASAYFWVEVAHIVPKGKETDYTKRERLKALSSFFGRPITSTKQLSADELIEAGQAIHDLYLSWPYERAAEKAA